VSDTRHAARLALLRLAGRPVAGLGRLGRPAVEAGRTPRILLVRPDHLGDLLLATPTATVLREALPEARIDWLVGPWNRELACRAGGPADVLTLEFPGFTRRSKASAVEPYALLVREAARLRAHAYDAALILRPDHWWGAMLASVAGIPRRFGYSVAECTPFLTDTLPPPSGRHQHAVRANQTLARLAAARLSGRPPTRLLYDPHFAVRPDELDWARAWIAASFGGQTSEGRVVALHPGSGAILKNWLPERWAELVRCLRADHGARVFVTGGPGDREGVESIAAHLDSRPPVLIGETTLGQLAALFASADLVLGCDSGPLHLAAAVGARTIRLYGPTDPVEFGPWAPRDEAAQHRAVAAALPCQPCRALVGPPCGAVAQPACMQAIGVRDVLRASNEILARVRKPC